MTTPLHPQTEPSDLGEHNRFPVYAMPMFGLVAVSDPEATVHWFTEVLEFEVMYEGPRVGDVSSSSPTSDEPGIRMSSSPLPENL